MADATPDLVLPDSAADQDEFDLEQELQDPAFEAAFCDATARYDLIEALTAARRQQQLSQTKLAGIMSTTQSAVSAIESGGTDPRISTLQRYARGVGLALHWDLVPAHTRLVKVEHGVPYLPEGKSCVVRTVIHQAPEAEAALAASAFRVLPSRAAG